MTTEIKTLAVFVICIIVFLFTIKERLIDYYKNRKPHKTNLNLEKQQQFYKEVKEFADSISKSQLKIGDTNQSQNKKSKQLELYILNLCKMYKITHL